MSELKDSLYELTVRSGLDKTSKILREINKLSLRSYSLEIIAIDKWGIRIYVAGQVNKLKRNEYPR
jgi:hypothetical protein